MAKYKLVASVAITMAIVFCQAWEAKAQRTLKVGTIPIAPELPFQTALAKGFLEAEGIKVETQIMAGGGVLVPALAGGSLQLGHSAYIPVFQARDAGFDITIVYPLSQHVPGRDTSFVIVRADSNIKTAKDLEGRPFAINVLKSINWLYMSEWMAKNDADPTKIRWVELPFPDMIPALRAKQVDGGTPTEPFVTVETEKGGLRLIDHYMTAVDREQELSGVVGTEKWIKDNQALVERFVAAMRKGTDYINSHPKEWPQLVAQYTRLKPELLTKATMPLWRYPIKVERVQSASDLTLKWGLIKKKQEVGQFIWLTALK